ncbi:MAG: DUF4389 domain-containing protein [Actinomycetota bacterium]|nr:DUF4389 domain-containing protein [Actinomycetota bacterium]
MSAPNSDYSPHPSATLSSNPSYPVVASLDSPHAVARWRVIGNYVMAIPHLVVVYVLTVVAEIMALAGWFAIVFTGKLPAGIGNFIAGVQRYQWRVTSFALFLREAYPTFGLPSGYADPGGDVATLNITPATSYSRIAVILRFILIIPQALFGLFLFIGLYLALVVGFFAVLFTGKWPEGVRRFVIGVEFWSIRLNAWYFLLADPYPPFAIG